MDMDDGSLMITWGVYMSAMPRTAPRSWPDSVNHRTGKPSINQGKVNNNI